MKKIMIISLLTAMLLGVMVNLTDGLMETEAATIVSTEIKYDNRKVNRVFGSNRYATSLAVSDVYLQLSGKEKLDTVILANGAGFADALAGSCLSFVKGAPIIINDANAEKIRDYVRNNMSSNGTVYILGGTAAVSQNAEDMFSDYNVIRLAGSNRYGTNLEILKEAGLNSGDLLVATGTNFADSLSASATGFPILLVGDYLKDDQLAMLEESSFENIWILGGEKAVNASVEQQLREYGNVGRIAGGNRYETSVKIAEGFFGYPDRVVLAYSDDFPDGLCGGPAASLLHGPVILCKSERYSEANKYIKDQGIVHGAVLGGAARLTDEAVRDIFGLDDEYQLAAVRKSFFYTDEQIAIIENNLPEDLKPYYRMLKEIKELPVILTTEGIKTELIPRYIMVMRDRKMSAEDAVAFVNANKDYIPYDDLDLTAFYDSYETVADPSSYTAIVSKKFYIGTYAPTDLVMVPSAYRGNYQPLRERALQAYMEMSDAAVKAGYNRIICYSNYRPYAEQKRIYNDNVAAYGVRATDKFSARPGFSEHQTGLTSDIAEAGSSYHYFDQYKGYQWVLDNAHRFGLILRYPKGKEYITGYAHEWWHFRYVGIDEAKKIHDSGLTMEEYYGRTQ